MTIVWPGISGESMEPLSCGVWPPALVPETIAVVVPAAVSVTWSMVVIWVGAVGTSPSTTAPGLPAVFVTTTLNMPPEDPSNEEGTNTEYPPDATSAAVMTWPPPTPWPSQSSCTTSPTASPA